MPESDSLPHWAPRVQPWKIRRLYELDAQGINDDELLLDVGWALLARCRSFILAVRATCGEALCPECGAFVPHEFSKRELLVCACGWSLTWGDYFRTIQKKQLSGAEPVLELFQDYVDRFPRAKTPRDQMLLIDALLHGFHWSSRGGNASRPVAVNLLECRLSEAIAFLDDLTYGPNGSPELRATKAEWDKHIVNAKSWGRPKKGRIPGPRPVDHDVR